MKKFLVSLMAILGMALCFTACDNDENKDNDKSSATTSGESLYQSVTDYNAAETDSDKIIAAAKILGSYNDYKQNKDTEGWVKDFATGAVSALAEEKKENAKAQLLEKLADGTLVSETTSDKIVAVANLASELGSIFGSAK